jgi:hypothetical protein
MRNAILKYSFALALAALLISGCKRNQQYDTNPQSEQQCGNCSAGLKMLDGAKKLWAEQNGKTTSDTPKMEDLAPFMRGTPACPTGGNYTITPVGSLSTCSVPEHTAYYQKSVTEKKTDTP